MNDLLSHFSEAEKQIMLQCAGAITEGPFIHEIEFGTRIGVKMAEAKLILQNTDLFTLDGLRDYDRESHLLLINNGMGEVTGLDASTKEWELYVIYPKESIREVLKKWCILKKSDEFFRRFP